MGASSLQAFRDEAKRLGVTWSDVVAVKRECQELMLQQREGEEAARQRAWELFLHYSGRSVAGCRGFWRVGWDKVRARLDNKGLDYTSLPGYDLLVRDLADELPEWQGRSTEELFDFLFSTYEPRPTSDQLYAEALGRIEAAGSYVPF